MVPTDDNCEHRSSAGPRIVLVEVTKVAIFPGHRHAIEIMLVANGLDRLRNVSREDHSHALLGSHLEVPADDKKIKFGNSPSSRQTLDSEICVNSIQATVTATDNGNFRTRQRHCVAVDYQAVRGSMCEFDISVLQPMDECRHVSD